MTLPDFLNTDSLGYIQVAGHRVGLDLIVAGYRRGESVETLHARFPSVPLAKLHKVIAFYLENEAEVGAIVDETIAEAERQRREAPKVGPSLDELRRRFEAQRLAKGA